MTKQDSFAQNFSLIRGFLVTKTVVDSTVRSVDFVASCTVFMLEFECRNFKTESPTSSASICSLF